MRGEGRNLLKMHAEVIIFIKKSVQVAKNYKEGIFVLCLKDENIFYYVLSEGFFDRSPRGEIYLADYQHTGFARQP